MPKPGNPKVISIGSSAQQDWKLVFGEHTTVAASDVIDTGLRGLAFVQAHIASAPIGTAASAVAVKPASGGLITVTSYAQAGTPATTFGAKVAWFAIGY